MTQKEIDNLKAEKYKQINKLKSELFKIAIKTAGIACNSYKTKKDRKRQTMRILANVLIAKSLTEQIRMISWQPTPKEGMELGCKAMINRGQEILIPDEPKLINLPKLT
jgi:hypothetical protein